MSQEGEEREKNASFHQLSENGALFLLYLPPESVSVINCGG